MLTYKAVIGLEVHVELNTKTKMFCRCSADYFGKEPNSQTCPVCLGLPGALPYINEEAINKCIQIGLALGCKINPVSYFERKNYFYPDLAKGFQTSQLVLPVAVKGQLEVEGADGKKILVRINRVHQEEDTGKLTHLAGETLIDFNRSSVPLVEIVTEPDFTDSSQIRDYAKKLQQVFRYLGVSEADMEKGQMRLEANVSVRKVKRKKGKGISSHPELVSGSNEEISKQVRDDTDGKENWLDPKLLPPYRVELKNINSFRFMVAAVEFEIERQIKLYEEDREDELRQETRGWNEAKKETFVQRSKEEAHDYRYFPEPDLPELKLEDEVILLLKQDMPELPFEKFNRYIKDWSIKESDAKILVEDKNTAEFFEKTVNYGLAQKINPTQIANYIINQKIDLLNSSDQQVVDDIIAKKSQVIDDDAVLTELANKSIDENPETVKSYKSGKENALMALVGGVMRKSQGRANPQKVKKILEQLLKN